MNIIPPSQPPPRQLGPEDVKIIIAEFSLGAENDRCTVVRPDLSTLLLPPHLATLPRRQQDRAAIETAGGRAGGAAAPGVIPTVGPNMGPWPGLVRGTSPVCTNIARNQEDRRIYLRVYDLLTLFPNTKEEMANAGASVARHAGGFGGRWLDSVVIDANNHVLLKHCPFRDVVYINSAEHDPSLNEIARTPPCYKYIICPLFYRSHWTILFISHASKRIRYLNSQVVDKTTPEFQTRPFRELFPGYHVSLLTPTKQCDYSSCGVICCLWTYIFLFFDEEEMDRIKCADIDPYRKTILQQLILSFILLNKSLQ